MSSIDLGSDVQYNIAQLFHRIYTGEYVTGTFTLSRALPNVDTEVFDTGLSEVTGCAIIDLTNSAWQTANTPEYNIFCYYQKSGDNVYQYSIKSQKKVSSGSNISYNTFLARVSSYNWTDGALHATASFDGNANYTPFYPNHEYRWIAW